MARRRTFLGFSPDDNESADQDIVTGPDIHPGRDIEQWDAGALPEPVKM